MCKISRIRITILVQVFQRNTTYEWSVPLGFFYTLEKGRTIRVEVFQRNAVREDRWDWLFPVHK